jgi:hypothetical protein
MDARCMRAFSFLVAFGNEGRRSPNALVDRPQWINMRRW